MIQASFTVGELMVMHAATQTSLTHLSAAGVQYMDKIGPKAYEVLLRDHERAIAKMEKAVKEIGKVNEEGNN